MLGARLRVEGLGRVDFSTPHLFAANHASFLDIPVLVGALPVDLRFLAKAELRSVPFLSRYIAAMGMVFIDRHDPDAARQSVEQVASVLEAGASLAAFPEGSRSRSGELQPVKTGAFIAAIKSEVPIVPVRILGSAAVLPPDSFSPRSGTVRVVVGDPIPSRGCGLEDRRRLAERVWRRVGELGGDPPERVGFH
jgi:1-acyl-sn-glycerol-3-phosphate acyltransferase